MKESWYKQQLGEIASFESGNRPAGGVGQLKEGALSLGGEHIGRNGRINLSSAKFVSEEYYQSNKKGHVIGGDILLCKDGALTGKVAIEQGELQHYLSMVNEHVFIIRTTKLLQRYLFYYLFSPIGQGFIKERITGSAQGGINGTQLKTIPVPFPKSLAEQERIVAELDLLSGIIDKQKTQLKELDTLAQSIFYDMFGDMEHNERGWVIGTIGQHIRLQGGFAFKSKDYCSEGVKLIQIANVNKDFVSWDIVVNLPNNYCQKYSSFSLIEGDILMAMTRPVIKSLNSVKIVEVRKLDMPCLLNQRVGRFIIDEKHFDKKWFVHYCKQDYFKQEVIKYSENSIQPNISSKEVEGFAIMIPPLDLQKEFSSKLRAIESLKESINKSIAESQKLFDYTMDKHFG